jgi:hypothetical protein
MYDDMAHVTWQMIRRVMWQMTRQMTWQFTFGPYSMGFFLFLFSITISPIGLNVFLAQLQIGFYFFIAQHYNSSPYCGPAQLKK